MEYPRSATLQDDTGLWMAWHKLSMATRLYRCYQRHAGVVMLFEVHVDLAGSFTVAGLVTD